MWKNIFSRLEFGWISMTLEKDMIEIIKIENLENEELLLN